MLLLSIVQIIINFAQSRQMNLATRKSKQIYLIFSTPLLLTACGHSKKVDVSNIPLTVTIQRFDHDFDKMRTGPMAPEATYLERRYGIFYRDFIAEIVPASNIKDTTYFMPLRQVFTTTYNGRRPYFDLKHDVDSVYPGNMEKQSSEIAHVFKRLKYFSPRAVLPANIYAYFSGFQAQTMIGDNYLAIGLDMFLGAD